MSKGQKVSAQQRANKSALISYGVMNFILIACYLLEVVKKSRTFGFDALTNQNTRMYAIKSYSDHF